MKFSKRPNVAPRAYRNFREWTREDFRCFCAYCFRHEDEVGGLAHFDQDHFEPKAGIFANPSRTNDYYNLYWCCKECNSPQNKGSQWPDPAARSRGEGFCDPCVRDPELFDYQSEADFSLTPITPQGRYTIRVLRLNERPTVRKLRRERANCRSQYAEVLNTGCVLTRKLREHPRYKADPAFKETIDRSDAALLAIRKFVERTPFTISDIPPSFSLTVLQDRLDSQ